MKLSNAGTVLWKQTESTINLRNPQLSDGYIWASMDLKKPLLSAPLKIIAKNNRLYAQHGALRQIRDLASGAVIKKTYSPYFFGSLFEGHNGKLYSLGTRKQSDDYHAVYYHDLAAFDDNFELVGLTGINSLPPSDNSTRSGTIQPDAIMVDQAGEIFVTGMHCVSKELGCGAYTARLKKSGDVLNAVASIAWQSTYNPVPYYGSRGNMLVSDGAYVYVAVAFGQEGSYTRGVLKYAR